MQRPPLNRRRAMFSVLIACAASALAWAFNVAWFLTLPGGLLTMALFGQVASMSNRPLRLVLNIFATSIVLYLGAALWTWGNSNPKQAAPSATRALLIFWLILLVPWMLAGPLSAMAFDGGATPEAYAFFWSVITYPVSVALAALFRKWFPYAVLLPVLNFAGCFASPLLHKEVIIPTKNSVTVIGGSAPQEQTQIQGKSKLETAPSPTGKTGTGQGRRR